MKNTLSKRTRKSVIAILSIFFFLGFIQASTISALAAEEWQLWPKGKEAPPAGTQPRPPGAPPPDQDVTLLEESGAAKAGEEGGKKTAGGISAGTIGWTVAIIAGLAAIGIAVGSGGGGSTSNH